MNKLPEWWPHDKPYAIMDCLEGMKQLPNKCVDLVLTDPPYGVGLDEWDATLIDGWFEEVNRLSDNVVFTPGIRNIEEYPKPKWIICWAKPGSTRRNDTGGFNHWEPLLYYGNKKVMVDFLYLPDVINHSDVNGHPCPKPINLFQWIIESLTEEGDIILDPFLGSGTTLLACKKTDRIGLGFEITPEYEHIIKQRMNSFIPSKDTEEYF